MNVKSTLAAALIALFAGSAIAAEGTQEFTDAKALSSKSRAEAVAELKNASNVAYGEASPAPVAQSTLQRTRVAAEAREALRLGLIAPSEVQVAPTAAQLEQIRIAGDRAVGRTLAVGE